MRLLTSTLWRAFPELDEFSDDLCRKFVKAATARWRSQALRFVLVGLVAVATVVVAVFAFAIARPIYDTWILFRTLPNTAVVLIQAVGLSIPLLIGFACALVVRDQILRRQVCRVIRKRGACVRCAYSLLGMPVNAALHVVCPECGMTTVVDPALGELASVGEHRSAGAGVYVPVAPVIDPERSRRRWKMIRKTVKWGAWGAFVLLLLLAGLALYIWSGLNRDANRARQILADDTAAATLYEQLIKGVTIRRGRSMSTTDGEMFAIFDAFVFAEAGARKETLRWNGGPEAYLTTVPAPAYMYLGWPPEVVATWYRGTSKEYLNQMDQQRDEALAIVRILKNSDGAKRLAEVADRLPWVMTRSRASGWTASTRGLTNAAMVRAMDYSLALAYVARSDLDRPLFMQALEQMLATAEAQATSAPLGYALRAINARTYAASHVAQLTLDSRTSDWLADAQSILVRYLDGPPMDLMIRAEAEAARDSLATAYTNPIEVVRKRYQQESSRTPPWQKDSTFDHSLEENLRTLTEAEVSSVSLSQREPHARLNSSAATLPPSQWGLSLPWAMSFITAADEANLRVRGTIVLLGIHRFHARTGKWPASLEELTQADLGTDIPRLLDPYSGKPFGYRVLDPTLDGQQRSFLLYSVGPDSIDDGGNPPVVDPRLLPQGITPTKRSDVILNPAPEKQQK
jgi:hypothetical protein